MAGAVYPTGCVRQESGAAQLGAPGPGSLMGSQLGWGPGLQSRLGSARVGSAPDSLTWRLETSVLPTWPLRWLPAATVPPTVSDSGESAGVCLLPSPVRDRGGGAATGCERALHGCRIL